MRPSRRVDMPSLGVVVLWVAAIGNLVLWVVTRPPLQPTGRYIGEFLGVEAVLLFSCALVLATLLRGIERAFGGLDRVALWHRYVSVAAVVLMILHPLPAKSTPVPDVAQFGLSLGSIALWGLLVLAVWALAPSLRAARWSRLIRWLGHLSHERWLTGHRLTGLLVVAAVVHGAWVDPVLRASSTLKVTYLAIGAIGIAAYLYRELLARYVIPIYDYTVVDVRRPNDKTIDVFLEATGRSVDFAPGQFIFLAFGGYDGWQRHPFTVASAPKDRRLEVTIGATGDYTHELQDKLKPGTPAKVAGPYGGFDYRHGGRQQIWIAGGMGITPFMSWIRALDEKFDRDVALYYSVGQASDALFLDEIRAAAAAHPGLSLHLHDSSQDGYLTAEEAAGGVPISADLSVYICGPPGMMTGLAQGFEHLGIPRSRIRWERFNIR
jgi:predicted ferric reductase